MVENTEDHRRGIECSASKRPSFSFEWLPSIFVFSRPGLAFKIHHNHGVSGTCLAHSQSSVTSPRKGTSIKSGSIPDDPRLFTPSACKKAVLPVWPTTLHKIQSDTSTKTNKRKIPSLRYVMFHAMSDHQTDIRLKIAHGVKLEVP